MNMWQRPYVAHIDIYYLTIYRKSLLTLLDIDYTIIEYKTATSQSQTLIRKQKQFFFHNSLIASCLSSMIDLSEAIISELLERLTTKMTTIPIK